MGSQTRSTQTSLPNQVTLFTNSKTPKNLTTSKAPVPSPSAKLQLPVAGEEGENGKHPGRSRGSLDRLRRPGGRKSGRNARRVVTAGRRPVDDTFPLSNVGGATLSKFAPLDRGQCCGRGPLVTRYMPTKDMDAGASLLRSRRGWYSWHAPSMTWAAMGSAAGTNYDSPWARRCAGIDDESWAHGCTWRNALWAALLTYVRAVCFQCVYIGEGLPISYHLRYFTLCFVFGTNLNAS